MVERFQISIFIMIIGFRNILEISGGGLNWDYVLEGIMIPLLVTFLSEVIVDWLKHSFITKFNGIAPDVYPTFIDILCKDYARASSGRMNVRHSFHLMLFFAFILCLVAHSIEKLFCINANRVFFPSSLLSCYSSCDSGCLGFRVCFYMADLAFSCLCLCWVI